MRPAPDWETVERDHFLTCLRQEPKIATLLELGAATGRDAAFFEAHGLDVVCVDLSPRMVEHCRARGLVAQVMDVADLRFPRSSFDAVYAMNCLVHVPRSELRAVLRRISHIVRPDGLFYLGLYGGREFEGVWEEDYFEPKRFFCHYLDEDLCALAVEFFTLQSFRRVLHGWSGLHFQSLILRRPSSGARS